MLHITVLVPSVITVQQESQFFLRGIVCVARIRAFVACLFFGAKVHTRCC